MDCLNIHRIINKLIKTIKHILEVFPEAVLIQSLDDKTKQFVLKFINHTANKNLVDYESPLDRPIDDNLIKVVVKNVQTSSQSDETSSQGCVADNVTLSSLLDYHQSMLDDKLKEVVSAIEVSSGQAGGHDENTHFSLKSVKVNWQDFVTSYMHVFINMTHAKKYENEKLTNEVLQMTFSSVSHEFRTPLNAFTNAINSLEINSNEMLRIINTMNLHRLEVDALKASNEKYFKIGKISSTLMLGLTEDILDIAKMASGTFNLNEEPFSVSALLDEIDYLFAFQWLKKHLFFKIEADNAVRQSTFCSDVGRIKQILMNLISNAVKFTQLGGITLGVKINRVFDENHFNRQRVLELSVKDTGVGISREDMKDLFKMFGTVKKHQHNLNKRGTGIGLSLSKKLVESMRGKLTVTSHEGFGSEFRFNIKETAVRNNRVEEEKIRSEGSVEVESPSLFRDFSVWDDLVFENSQPLKFIQIHDWDLKLK